MARSRGVDDGSFICFTEDKVTTANECLDNGVTVIEDQGNDQESERQLRMDSDNSKISPLILNEEDEILFTGDGQSNEVVSSVASACSSIAQVKNVQDVLEDVFYSMALSEDGRVEVSKLLGFIKLNVDSSLEYEVALDELWYMFDQNGKDGYVDIGTFREVMAQWMSQLHNRSTNLSIGDNSGNSLSLPSPSTSPLSSSPVPNRPSSFGLIDSSMLMNCTFGSLEGIGGDVSQRDHLELTAELKEMHFKNKILNERLDKLVTQISSTEEVNTALADEKTELNKRLSCYQSSLLKSKDVEETNAELNNKLLKCESDNGDLRKRIDELKKENSTLETRIQNMKEDLSIAWSDVEQMKLSKECLQQELNNLNAKVEKLELSIELKEIKLVEETKRCQENEMSIFYWRTRSEESTAEKDKLEMELSKAQQDIEGLKRKFTVSEELRKVENTKLYSEKLQSPPKAINNWVPYSHAKEVTQIGTLSIRQEMEGLLDEDDKLPNPFCGKITRAQYQENGLNHSTDSAHQSQESEIGSRSHLIISELPGENGVVDCSEDGAIVQNNPQSSKPDSEVLVKWKKQMVFALKLVLASKREATSLLTFCEQLKTGSVVRSTSNRYIAGVTLPIGCGDSKLQKYHTALKSTASSDFVYADKSHKTSSKLADDLEKLLDGSESESDDLFDKDLETTNDYSTVGSVIVKELQSLPADLGRCREVLTVAVSSPVAKAKYNDADNANSIWGKSRNLSNSSNGGQNYQQEGNRCHKLLQNHRSSSSPHTYKFPAATNDIYQRLIAAIEFRYRNSVTDVSSFEDQFYKVMLTMVDRRASLFKRVQLQSHKRAAALKNVDKEFNKIQTCFQNDSLLKGYWEKQLIAFENSLANLSHECEGYGAIQEEAVMYSFVDNLVQYFDNILAGKESLKEQKNATNELNAGLPHPPASEIQLADAEVQCQIANQDDSSIHNHVSAIEVKDVLVDDLQSREKHDTKASNYYQYNRFCHIFRCWKAKFCDIFWSSFSDTHVTMSSCSFLGVITIVVLGTVMCCLLNYGNSSLNCSSTLNDAACGKSWSEILRPHVEQRHPPHIF